jgi:hypothetical protein
LVGGSLGWNLLFYDSNRSILGLAHVDINYIFIQFYSIF